MEDSLVFRYTAYWDDAEGNVLLEKAITIIMPDDPERPYADIADDAWQAACEKACDLGRSYPNWMEEA